MYLQLNHILQVVLHVIYPKFYMLVHFRIFEVLNERNFQVKMLAVVLFHLNFLLISCNTSEYTTCRHFKTSADVEV